VFLLHGEDVLAYDPAPDDALHAQIERAAAACSVQAIHHIHAGGSRHRRQGHAAQRPAQWAGYQRASDSGSYIVQRLTLSKAVREV
jgi:hypothetical protein